MSSARTLCDKPTQLSLGLDSPCGPCVIRIRVNWPVAMWSRPIKSIHSKKSSLSIESLFTLRKAPWEQAFLRVNRLSDATFPCSFHIWHYELVSNMKWTWKWTSLRLAASRVNRRVSGTMKALNWAVMIQELTSHHTLMISSSSVADLSLHL